MLSSSPNSTTVLSRVPTQNMFIIQGVSWSFFLTGDKGRGSGVQEGLNAQENLKLTWKAEKAKSVKCPYPACLPCLGSVCSKEQARVGSWTPFACSHTSVAPTLLLVGNSAQAVVYITKKTMILCTEEILCTQKMGTALGNEPFHAIETNILFCICSYHPS